MRIMTLTWLRELELDAPMLTSDEFHESPARTACVRSSQRIELASVGTEAW
jgi:hypothetical protein